MAARDQYHWIQSNVAKYLLDEQGEPSAIETTNSVSFGHDKWIDWTTPDLQ